MPSICGPAERTLREAGLPPHSRPPYHLLPLLPNGLTRLEPEGWEPHWGIRPVVLLGRRAAWRREESGSGR